MCDSLCVRVICVVWVVVGVFGEVGVVVAGCGVWCWCCVVWWRGALCCVWCGMVCGWYSGCVVVCV